MPIDLSEFLNIFNLADTIVHYRFSIFKDTKFYIYNCPANWKFYIYKTDRELHDIIDFNICNERRIGVEEALMDSELPKKLKDIILFNMDKFI